MVTLVLFERVCYEEEMISRRDTAWNGYLEEGYRLEMEGSLITCLSHSDGCGCAELDRPFSVLAFDEGAF